MLEPDLQPKPLDVCSWSYSASLKFEFPICRSLISGSAAIAVYDTENAFAKIHFLRFNISKVPQNLSKFKPL